MGMYYRTGRLTKGDTARSAPPVATNRGHLVHVFVYQGSPATTTPSNCLRRLALLLASGKMTKKYGRVCETDTHRVPPPICCRVRGRRGLYTVGLLAALDWRTTSPRPPPRS